MILNILLGFYILSRSLWYLGILKTEYEVVFIACTNKFDDYYGMFSCPLMFPHSLSTFTTVITVVLFSSHLTHSVIYVCHIFPSLCFAHHIIHFRCYVHHIFLFQCYVHHIFPFKCYAQHIFLSQCYVHNIFSY